MVFPGFAVEVVLAQLEHGAPMASVEPVKALDVTGEPVEGAMGHGRASPGRSNGSRFTSFLSLQKNPGEPVTER